MQVVIEEDSLLAEDARLIRRLYKVQPDENFTEGLKFAYQYLLLKKAIWLEVCRVDNCRHDRQRAGTHVHRCGSEEVKFIDMNFIEARKYILDLGERMSDKLRRSNGED